MGSGAKSYLTNAASSYKVNYLRIPYILGHSSSYMTLHPISSEFPYIWGKFYFIFISVLFSVSTKLYLFIFTKSENMRKIFFSFYQCGEARTWRTRGRTTRTRWPGRWVRRADCSAGGRRAPPPRPPGYRRTRTRGCWGCWAPPRRRTAAACSAGSPR